MRKKKRKRKVKKNTRGKNGKKMIIAESSPFRSFRGLKAFPPLLERENEERERVGDDRRGERERERDGHVTCGVAGEAGSELRRVKKTREKSSTVVVFFEATRGGF